MTIAEPFLAIIVNFYVTPQLCNVCDVTSVTLFIENEEELRENFYWLNVALELLAYNRKGHYLIMLMFVFILKSHMIAVC